MMKSMAMAALSWVIAVWCGTSRYCSRRSTQEMRSVIGFIKISPGPVPH